MKKFFGLLFIAIAFTACSSDDDNNTTSVEGTWKLTAFETENAYDLNNDGTASRSVMNETNCYQNETVVFKANGTGQANNTSYAEIEFTLVTGTTDQYEYWVTCVPETETIPFLYTQNGNNVTITMGATSQPAVLSGNTLTYVINKGFLLEVEENGDTTTVLEDITFVFTRQ